MSSEVDTLKEQVDGLRKREGILINSHKAMGAKLDGIGSDIHTIKTAIMGDPTRQDQPAILNRLDRLEQTERIRSKILWLLGGGFVTLFFERLKAYLP